jgi:hypothetical protein
MEQVQQLIEILKSTPEMALWGLGMFFVWTLLKMASWVSAGTMLVKLGINKLYSLKKDEIDLKGKELEIRLQEVINTKEKSEHERDIKKGELIFSYLDKQSISKGVYKEDWEEVIDLTHKICKDSHSLIYMHKHNMDRLKIILKHELKRINKEEND